MWFIGAIKKRKVYLDAVVIFNELDKKYKVKPIEMGYNRVEGHLICIEGLFNFTKHIKISQKGVEELYEAKRYK